MAMAAHGKSSSVYTQGEHALCTQLNAEQRSGVSPRDLLLSQGKSQLGNKKWMCKVPDGGNII